MTNNVYCIYVTPSNKNFGAHIWKEGGLFLTEKQAEVYVKQLRKMKQVYDKGKKFYKKVEVLKYTN